MVKIEYKIDKDLSTLESLVEIIREKSRNCDPEIVHPLGQHQVVVDRLLATHKDISEDPRYKTRFEILMKNFGTYRAEYSTGCICQKKK